MSQAETFEELVSEGEPFDVLRGVCILAKDEYPSLDIGTLVTELDDLARPLVGAGLAEKSAAEQAEALRVQFYEVGGYSGNEADYYDPKNSLLSDVLERRRGIPISLALVYTEVAKRAGVKARGVAFPGHFLVRIDDARGGTAVIDPFFGGKVLSQQDLEGLLRRVAGQANVEEPSHVSPEMLEPASPRTVLLRWLMNLRGVHLQRADYARAMVVMDRIVTLAPEDAAALRDRGLLAAKLGAIAQACADLERAASYATDPALASRARGELARLKTKRSSVN